MGTQALALISYLLVAGILVFLSIKLSDFVDLLDKKTKVSGAFLGGILLAAVTSLPELFTSLTATIFIQENNYVVGNILGSNLFNITLFGLIYIIFFKKMVDSKVNKIHLFSIMIIGLLYACVTIAGFVFNFNDILIGWFNPMSFVILLLYIFAVVKTPKIEEAETKEETTSKLTVKQIIILFITFSLLLIGTSIGVTYLTDWVIDVFSIGSTFGGALFLGVATSLPEVTATIALCHKKNFNAAYGNILGSNIFNFAILTIADALSFKAGPLYQMDQSSFLLIVCGVFSLIALLIPIIMQISKKVKNITSHRIIFIGFSILLLSSYGVFMWLSNVDLSLSFAPYIVG